MKKKLSILLAAALIVSGLSGCGQSQTSSSASSAGSSSAGSAGYGEMADYISIGANPSGQTGYTWAAGISDLINKADLGTTATAEETSGYSVVARMILTDELEMGFVNNIILADAYLGQGNYSDYEGGKINSVLSLAPTEMHIITLPGSGVESIHDLAGKRVGVGQPGGVSLEITTMMLEAAGYEPGDLEELQINLANQMEYLRDGQLDVAIWIGTAPLPAVTELCATKDVVFLDVDDETIKNLQEMSSVFESCTIPAGTYTGQDQDINTFCVRNVLAASSNLSDETVYQVTKLIMEHVEDLSKVHQALGTISPETVLLGLTKDTPLHPGALRYYQEIGVPGLENLQ